MIMRKLPLAALILAGAVLLACNSDGDPTTSANQGGGTPATKPSEPTIVKTDTLQQPDGSTIVVKTYSDGSKTEERSFASGPLTKVTRQTTADGKTSARVTHRDTSEETELEDESWVDRSMEATGDALATAAEKTKAGAGTAVDATKKGAATAVDATKEGAVTAADATKKGAVKTAEVTTDAAKKTGSAAKKGAKSVGKGAKKLGGKLKDAVKN
jgi:hypothetical protein